MRRCAPLVVANGSANAGGNQARGKGAHAGYQHVVFCPCEFFYRPERDNVTNPIGARLRGSFARGSFAFHCPHLLPGQALLRLDREQRSEERRVGKEGRSRWWRYHYRKKM